MKINGCIFCYTKDLKLFETKNFYVVQDAYPLVEGHLMIVSKEHYSCSGEINEDLVDEIRNIKTTLAIIIKKKYKCVSFYEHGRAGSCTPNYMPQKDCHHMHIHALPFCKDIHSQIAKKSKGLPMENFSKILDLYNSFGEYLYFENYKEEGKFYPTKNVNIPSHFLRTLIANEIGEMKRANWSKMNRHNAYEESWFKENEIKIANREVLRWDMLHI